MKSTVSVALLCLMIPFLAVAQDSTKIIAMENLWNRAELSNDANAVKLLLADDFIMTVAEGTLYNKAQTLASVADKSYRPEVLQSTGLIVHSYGNTAVVTGTLRERSGQGQTLGAPRTLHRHMDEPQWKMAVHRQPLQRPAKMTQPAMEIRSRRARRWLFVHPGSFQQDTNIGGNPD